MAMWLGGWLVVSVLVLSARGESSQTRASFFGFVAKAHTAVIVPGALLTLGSGIMWSMAIAGANDIQSRVAPLGVWLMTAGGFLGGLLIVFVALPTAVKLKAVSVPTEDGKMLPVFESLRIRLLSVSSVAGVLALVSLFASVLAP